MIQNTIKLHTAIYTALFASITFLLIGCEPSSNSEAPKKTIMGAGISQSVASESMPDAVSAADGNGEVSQIAQIEALINENPNNANLWNARGVIFMQQGVLNEAAQSFNRAAEIDPNNTTAYFNLANLALLEQQIQPAVGFLQRVLSIDPNHEGAQDQLSRIMQIIEASQENSGT